MCLGSPFALNVGDRSSRAQRDTGIPPCPINGVPPLGLATQLKVFIDPDLLQYEEVWAAAGTWNDVFAVNPQVLSRLTNGKITEVKR